MRLPTRSFPLLVAIAAFASAAEAAVIVTFSEPDKYIDAGQGECERLEVFKEIERHLQRLGETYLPATHTLKIEVLDIDLAGEERFRPRFGGGDLRVLKGRGDWPSIRLRYELEAAGKAGHAREETLSDLGYLMSPITRPERLPYEKRMLERWFKARFAPA